MAFNGNAFNYNIYTYFHIGAMTAAHVWGHDDLASSLMQGLVARFDEYRNNPDLPNITNPEIPSDRVGWLTSCWRTGSSSCRS